MGSSPPRRAEWGDDLQRAIEDAGAGIWWTGLFPGLAIVLLVTGFTLVGEGLNDVLNPVIRQRRIAKPTIPAPAGAGAPATGAERAPAAPSAGQGRPP